VTVQFAVDDAALPAEADVHRWLDAVVQHKNLATRLQVDRGMEVTVRVVGDDESRALNKTYRGRDAATNVLSFPAGDGLELPVDEPAPLGDLVLCAPLIGREASAQGKNSEDHWGHLLVHGMLHLLGYDHQDEAEAVAMESLETEILALHGVENPYIERESGG